MIAMILENDHNDCSNFSKWYCIMIAIFSWSYYNHFFNTPFFRDKTPFFSLIYHEKQAFFIRKGIFYGMIINIILIVIIKRSFAICLFFTRLSQWIIVCVTFLQVLGSNCIIWILRGCRLFCFCKKCTEKINSHEVKMTLWHKVV